MATKPIRKIGILGTTPSRLLAPIGDPEWDEFWPMGPQHQAFDESRRQLWHRWFEIHDVAVFDPNKTKDDPGYLDWLSRQTRPVYMVPPLDPRVPSAVVFPIDDLIASHGTYFLDSSISQMMAYIYDDPTGEFASVEEIGFWGCDFASCEERRAQKKGWFHFKKLFEKTKGIKITVPPESDLAYEPSAYANKRGIGRKIDARKSELLEMRKKTIDVSASLHQSIDQNKIEQARLMGALEMLDWLEDLT